MDRAVPDCPGNITAFSNLRNYHHPINSLQE